ncbi:hypothetical protein ACFPYM_03775 [Methylobacterium hispanicum]
MLTFVVKDGSGKYWGFTVYEFRVFEQLDEVWYGSNAFNPNSYGSLNIPRFSDPVMAMSKDGKTIAYSAKSPGGNNQVKIEIDTGIYRFDTSFAVRNDNYANYGIQPYQTLSAPAGSVGFGTSLSMSRGGEWLAIAAANTSASYQEGKSGGKVYMYRRGSSGYELYSESEFLDLPGQRFIGISDDGQVIAHDVRMSVNGVLDTLTAIRRWNGVSWVTEATLREFGGGSLRISSDGETIAFGGDTVRVYKRTGTAWSKIFTSPIIRKADGSKFGGPIIMNKAGTLIYLSGLALVTGTQFQQTIHAYEWKEDGFVPAGTTVIWLDKSSGQSSLGLYMSGNDDLSEIAITYDGGYDPVVIYWDRVNDYTKSVARIGHSSGTIGREIFMSGDGTMMLSRWSGDVWKRSKF